MATVSSTLIFSLFPLSLFIFLFLCFVHPPISTPIHPLLHFSALLDTSPPPPRIAYFISGTDGDVPRITRLLWAAYHPRNFYLLHLDHRASDKQMDELAWRVGSVRVFIAAENVNVVKKSNPVNEEGSSPLALVLHGAAILLRWKEDWDWFVNLDASDYPLIPQDDFLHVLSFIPRNLSFIEHTKDTWKEHQRIMEIVVDPRLYLLSKGKMFMSTKNRALPNAFKFASGSPHVILSRKFVEFSIIGWDNLPRTLLLYLTNTRFSHRGFFQTLACNSKEFSRTVINSNLRYIHRAGNVGTSDLEYMMNSGAAFAGGFSRNNPLLDLIDSRALHRRWDAVSPGGWCLGKAGGRGDPCLEWGYTDILEPGPGSKRFEKLVLKLMLDMRLRSHACNGS